MSPLQCLPTLQPAQFHRHNCISQVAPTRNDPPKQNLRSPSQRPMREAVLTPEDEEYLTLLEARRDQQFTTAPLLSGFRVLALFSYEDLDGQTDKFVIGANAECANIGGATCAERAAMAQLQLLPVRRVRKIYIVSDSPQCLTPGTLCREFLLSSPLVEESTPFVSRAAKCRPCVTTLAELYPFPSLYDRVPRSQVLPFARKFCSRFATDLHEEGENADLQQENENVTPFVRLQLSRMTPNEKEVYLKALAATEKDARDDLFPLRYAAGTKFSDGEVRVTWQHKTLEYGSSLDAVSKLIPFVEAKQNSIKPQFLMQVDQFGILHAPFARARAYFFEFGFLDVPVLVHDAEGALHRIPIDILVADSPDCIATSTAAVQ
ncbi:hypothetical protein F441_12209 [Phytophthora nicotianae CJ01A1]|uniref:CMP/dCMP-type deaminase domain-containing protein n=4 Tax=Phytophthora nicotianae TaxID=4792 RepID=W2Q154_PHYN3|nr:hypothetical protein PPTG_13845 [Phytophthora nicotianae INRA-310]ETL89328.1 hypothetical protein L917_11717 [Phytophthora nicotianae]ETN06020.1 hypothetical protein PPTG_13845 [Phytophthora nicotianae INRA-310]ETO71311.1 hypothetical protein F444_12332 [Phytophthora nicotianae P1976]ETP12423.1 hypothetical protein F441_12209 [Phytophthora nicotianae CJ01A1]